MILYLSTTDGSGSVRMRTLIVEDDPTSREALLRILKMLGYETASAATVADGLRALDREPACMILDLMLPDGNGMEILRHVREKKLPIRVAVLTGADKPMVDLAVDLGPDAVFSKPVDLNRLLMWLKAA